MRKIKEIIVHCSATAEGRDFTAADIDRWHRARNFACIGYHYVVRLDGTVEAGRPVEQIGAHCLGHNAESIGVCYIGGLTMERRLSPTAETLQPHNPTTSQLTPADTRTPAQKSALTRLIGELKRRYPGATVHGHREFAAKACPCFDAAKEYA